MKSFKILVAGVVLCSASAFAQTAASGSSTNQVTDQDIALMKQDISTAKMDVITHTMAFTEKEAAAFWPVYEQYATAQKADWRSEDCADQRLRSELRHDG